MTIPMTIIMIVIRIISIDSKGLDGEIRLDLRFYGMKEASRPKKRTEGQRKKRLTLAESKEKQRTVVTPRTVEELATLHSKGVNIRIVVDELAALWRVPVGNIYLRLHEKRVGIPVDYVGRYPRFWLGDAMSHLQK
jgi:hypothetical protein